jgi:pimeloyl-ACP methyl ester carboxylesterase
MAEDIREFLLTHGLSPVLLIGHSLGGKVAMQTALSFPDLISKLMVVDIAPRAYSRGHEKIIETLSRVRLAEAVSRNSVEEELMSALGEQDTVRFLMKNLGRNEDGSLTWKMNLPVIAANYHETLAATTSDAPFPKETLFVRGEKSDYIRDADLREITQLFPKATLETVAGAGHWVHADAMEELVEITRRFFE